MEEAVNISSLNDFQLLEFLCSTDNDVEVYEHFVERFLEPLQNECSKICAVRKLHHHIGIQIANEVFERVRKYKSFKVDQIRVTDCRKAVLAYLKVIAVRLFNDYHAQEKKKDVVHRSYLEEIILAQKSEIDVKALKNCKDISKIIFNKLNKKEQAVILMDIEYKKHQKYLPDEKINELALQLKVSPNSITKIRQRAVTKIKSAIDEINKN